MLDEARGIQWPCPPDTDPPDPQRRLFADGRFYHPDGRARFLFEEPRPTPEPPDRDFPLLLLTGRGSAAQWHTRPERPSPMSCGNFTRRTPMSRSITLTPS